MSNIKQNIKNRFNFVQNVRILPNFSYQLSNHYMSDFKNEYFYEENIEEHFDKIKNHFDNLNLNNYKIDLFLLIPKKTKINELKRKSLEVIFTINQKNRRNYNYTLYCKYYFSDKTFRFYLNEKKTYTLLVLKCDDLSDFIDYNIKELYSFDNSIVNDENKSYFNFFSNYFVKSSGEINKNKPTLNILKKEYYLKCFSLKNEENMKLFFINEYFLFFIFTLIETTKENYDENNFIKNNYPKIPISINTEYVDINTFIFDKNKKITNKRIKLKLKQEQKRLYKIPNFSKIIFH